MSAGLFAQDEKAPLKFALVPADKGIKIGRLTWKLRVDQTAGSIAVAEIENTDSVNEWGGAHVHTREDEIWYVMQGELEFAENGDTATAKPGDWVFGPRSLPHSYRVSKAPAKYLLIFSPGGIEYLFTEADSLRKIFPRRTPAMADTLEKVRAKYGAYHAKKWLGIKSATDPSNGVWELDPAASTFARNKGWKQQTQTWISDGKNTRVTLTGIDSKGKRVVSELIGAYDERDRTIGDINSGETLSQVRTDYYTFVSQRKINGLLVTTSTRVISPDGGTMTITTYDKTRKDATVYETLVFHKKVKEKKHN